MSISIADLQKLCEGSAIRWTDHALKRLMQRGILQAHVVQAICNGELVEQYPEDYPNPSCLLLGTTNTGEALHVVCGLDGERIWIITAYYPDPSEWEADFKTRRVQQ